MKKKKQVKELDLKEMWYMTANMAYCIDKIEEYTKQLEQNRRGIVMELNKKEMNKCTEK